MTSGTWSPVYEKHVAEDTVVNLHHLCAACSRLHRGSTLLRNMSRGKTLRLHAKETFKPCSVDDMKAGYLGGCHLCALLWTHAGGHRLDPATGPVAKHNITVCLEVREFEMEFALEYHATGLRKWWNKVTPHFIPEREMICLKISNIYDIKARYSKFPERTQELYIYPSSDRRLNSATFRHGTEPVSSKSNMKFTQIQSWYRQCSENHQKCIAYPNMVAPGTELPSRVLDLEGDKIKLECNVKKLSPLQYTTLSHMWGPDPNACLQLTKSRLREYQSDIPSSLLPTKYLEAIRIAKALGFRYIWINSLCIIQDSDEDWKKEALKMATVYGRTALNISKSCSANSTPLIVQHNPNFLNKFWSPSTYKQVWPLLSRAWVFQERLLCPRNIYYGQDRLLWECCQGLEDEFSGPLVDSPRSKNRFHAVFAGVQGSSLGREHDESFKGQWSLLVEEYRLANLTYEKDRVIAFAGIVKAVQSKTKFTYLAGIWKEFAELDLLWVLHPPSPLGEFYTRREELRQHVPSWSWLSAPPRLQSASTGSDTVDFSLRSEIYNRSTQTIYNAQIISFHHPKLASSPDALLHDSKGLSITLKTRKIPSTLEWDGPILRLLPHGRYALGSYKYIHPKNAMKYFHDDVSLLPGSPVPSRVCMILTTFEAWVSTGKKDHGYSMYAPSGDEVSTSWQYAGLAVVPAGKSLTGEDSWQRIGIFLFADIVDGLGIAEIPFSLDDRDEEVCLI
ncbi:hypothetical protein QQX98_009009 [Neonectria punicea]|uniref:Heterokaryon incompatibility domain-containing protein n=1 Tax=Neonectria punicea TaxID=979145 RepID=A0ABR1GTL0_9HYPO